MSRVCRKPGPAKLRQSGNTQRRARGSRRQARRAGTADAAAQTSAASGSHRVVQSGRPRPGSEIGGARNTRRAVRAGPPPAADHWSSTSSLSFGGPLGRSPRGARMHKACTRRRSVHRPTSGSRPIIHSRSPPTQFERTTGPDSSQPAAEAAAAPLTLLGSPVHANRAPIPPSGARTRRLSSSAHGRRQAPGWRE